MKKLLIATAATAMMAAPAFAATITISFANDDGTAAVWTLDDATNKAVSGDGVEADYTWDEATSTLCASIPEQGEVCAVFAEGGATEVGATSAYTLSSGGGGTATITAMTE